MSNFQTRCDSLAAAVGSGLRRGVEKESLRVQADGALATTAHPAALGSALTHPHITTDFSEAQLELITGVHQGVEACLEELRLIHRYVARHIDDEMLWCASMPCYMPEEDGIPIARYGRSNAGLFKTVYRMGLAHRYGRRMQLISGLHYNFSLAETAWPLADRDDANQAYFALIRNFRRHAWLLLYLFGASPAVCASFVAGRAHALQELASGTLYLPYATSLRMGRLGYSSAAQDALAVSYNDLPSYAASLEEALTKPYPPYAAIGIQDGEEYRQLSTSLLQIENEFYSTIRPKRATLPDERPLHALRQRGVQYVEVRAMDLDPFSAIGITAATMRFLDVFLAYCLLADSPPDTPREIAVTGRNTQLVAARGREPGLRLERDGEEIGLRRWAEELIGACEPVAATLDGAMGVRDHQQALAVAAAAITDPESLPSARVLREIQERYGGSFSRFALAQSAAHHRTLLAEPLGREEEARMHRLAAESHQKQRLFEASEQLPFEEYRRRYLAPQSLKTG